MPREIRRTGGFALTLLLLAPLLHAAPTPDWVRQAAAQTLGTYSPDTNAVVLLDATDNTLTGTGEYLEHRRRVVKILRPDGRDEGDLEVYLDHGEKLLSLHAWTLDAAGHEYELKEKDFNEVSPFDDDLYSDIRYRTATAPAAIPGSVIALEYLVRRRAWLNQLDWIFQEMNPVHEAEFSVQLPVGWEYTTAWADAKPVSPTQAGGAWQWTVHDVPGIEHEPRMPSLRSLSGRMALSFFGPGRPSAASWDQIGRWYIQLTADRRTVTPELAAKVQQLVAGQSTFDGKVRALAQFMQTEVRYVGIEIGIGGWQPHPAADVFHARYGDCKDKATLLQTMLQAAGIGSAYLVINTRRGVADPAVPSAFSFNHVIVAIEIPAGVNPAAYQSVITSRSGQRYLVFDPTDEYTPVGELRSELQQSYALLVTDSGGEMIRTPLLAPDSNRLTRDGKFALSSDGTLTGEVVETRSGDHATYERAVLLHANQEQRTQRLERELNESLRGFTLQSSDIQQLDQFQKNLVLTLKFTTPQYAQTRGPLMLVRPRVLDEKSFEVETKPRHYPFVLGGVSDETDTYEIDLPAGYKVDDVPDPVNVDMGFASYQSKVETTGSKIRYWRQLIVRAERVSPERVPDLRKFEGIVGADEMSAVVLTHQP
jgi:Domain of Unknown Function with PDB structure (DUF3857)/Transglutaminase-like superfamily